MKTLSQLTIIVAAMSLFASCCNKTQETEATQETIEAMKYESATFSSSAELPWLDVKPGITRQLMAYNDNIMLVHVRFDETMVGQKPALHTHPHPQISYVLSGKFEVHVGDSVRVCVPGDSYIAGPNVPHEAYALEAGEVLDCFSPIREEFIQK